MHSLEIKDIAIITVEGKEQMSVEVEVNDGEKTVLRRYGFPLGTSQEEIEADLKNVVAGLDSDAEAKVRNAEHEATLKKVDELREALKGKGFSDTGAKADGEESSE